MAGVHGRWPFFLFLGHASLATKTQALCGQTSSATQRLPSEWGRTRSRHQFVKPEFRCAGVSLYSSLTHGGVEPWVSLFAPLQKDASRDKHGIGDETVGVFLSTSPCCGCAQAQRADAITKIAPEPVDTDGRSAPTRMGNIGHRSTQIRVQHGHTETGYGGGHAPPQRSSTERHERNPGSANPHSPYIQQVPPNTIREPACEELCGAPGETVDAHYPSNARQTQPLLVQVDRPQSPDECIHKFLDQSGLAKGCHAPVAPTHQEEHLCS